MCSLYSTPEADEQFVELAAQGQPQHETRLARLADEDSVDDVCGLGILLSRVDAWQGDPSLKNVLTCRRGRHRFYVTGRNTECRYVIRTILVNKRDEDDKPYDARFQKWVLRALACDDSRLRHIPPPPDDDSSDNG